MFALLVAYYEMQAMERCTQMADLHYLLMFVDLDDFYDNASLFGLGAFVY